MPFDQELAARIRNVCKEHGDFHERKMFGGLAFMLGDKMCFGVLEDKLVARIGPENQASALKLPHVSPMDFTGKPLKGYVYVSSPAIRTTASLKKWISQCVAFTSTLTKSKNTRKRKTISELGADANPRGTPISKLINFGPVTRPEFEAMELRTFGDLEDLGWEAVCRKWVEHYPGRLNVNAFIGVIATLEGISWTKISASDRARARRLVNELRDEYGIPLARKSSRRRK